MSEVVGRAGFHVQHTKPVGDRRALVHEMMRELDEDSIAYWAMRNPSIVVEDEPLNVAMVNDGAGGFTVCTDRRQVIAYGDGRDARLKDGIKQDKVNKHGKSAGGTVTTTLMVSHLPKSMCDEIPNYYPRLDDEGNQLYDKTTGEPLMRSRWVAKDRDQAIQYFKDFIAYVAENVQPGGVDSIHGYDIQFSETTPHIQLMGDPYGVDEKAEEGAEKDLRPEWARGWWSHRHVKDEKGRVKTGPEKMREYHQNLKDHMLSLGYDVSPDFDEDLHLVGMGKKAYEQTQDALAEMRTSINNREKALKEDFYELKGRERDVEAREGEVEKREAALEVREQAIEEEEALLPKLRRRTAEAGRKDGQKAREDGEAAARKLIAEAESQEQEARRMLAQAAGYQKQVETRVDEAMNTKLGSWMQQRHPEFAREYRQWAEPKPPEALRGLVKPRERSRTPKAVRKPQNAAQRLQQQRKDPQPGE